MAASTMPPWQMEMLERKRSEKLKVEQMPAWKRELLKRLQTKSELSKNKIPEEAKDETLVLNEHILKVSDNVFVRQEIQRKMSDSHAPPLSPRHEGGYIFSDHQIVHKDRISMIERECVKNKHKEKRSFSNGEVLEVELPSAGIVSRLKGKFASDSKPRRGNVPVTIATSATQDRSTLKEISKSGENTEVPPKVVAPLPAGPPLHNDAPDQKHSLEEEPSRPNHLPAKSKTKEDDDTEIDLVLETLILESVKALDLPPASNEAMQADSVPEDQATKTHRLPPTQAPIVESTLPSVETVVPARCSTTLASSQSGLFGSNNKENVPEIPECRTAPCGKVRGKVDKLPEAVDSSINVQNNQIYARTDTCKIIDLGHTSMDPSLLKSKAAIAANEIMKESKTIMIIPKSKRGSSVVLNENSKSDITVTAHNVSLPKDSSSFANNTTEVSTSSNLDESSTTKTSVSTPSETHCASDAIDPNTTLMNEIEKQPAVISVDPSSTPTIDDDTMPSPTEEVKKSCFQPSESKDFSKNEDEKPTTNEVKSSECNDTHVPPPSKATTNCTKFVVSSNVNRSAATNKAPANHDAVKSLFGPRLGSSAGSGASSFGRKSFVIDPRKFKKSSAQTTATPMTKTINIKSATPSPNSGNMMVITPKPQTESRNSDPAKPEVTPGSKGKRKLTVDQITVIGGYVKLDHSNLSKPNKIRKGTRVKFDASHLESIYQYPSEASLLHEDREIESSVGKSKLADHQGAMKESQLGKYTPKYLLAMKESLADEDDDEDSDLSSKTSKSQ